MGFRIESPLAKAAGLLFATVALGYVVIREAWGFRIDALGSGPVEVALAVGAVLVVGALLVLTDNAFEG
ncbi:hypothetical protein [Halosimplex halophilum]|uniref:hypothetical protein n=1 Tax=Halosimplex halophilum TaxID=2559572 RepID=UPI00107FB135|nr:hypothetical protein [Halosimplex halophilum]